MAVYPIEFNQTVDDLAVEVKQLVKCFENGTNVLDKISMHVPTGKIYGLLGSSGCGKTTLVSCALGLTKWQQGSVTLLGTSTTKHGITSGIFRHIGYMPQELALQDQLTVKEIMHMYGRLYGKETWEIEANGYSLYQLLNLSSINSKLISTLSGGQKQRVSLALSLIHSPKLLILDEPTVGIDPLLRQCIWNHFETISTKNNVTIVVTTHYVEELKNAYTVGIMRKGRIIAEHSPKYLMECYQTTLLEDTVLKICREDGQGKIISSNISRLESRTTLPKIDNKLNRIKPKRNKMGGINLLKSWLASGRNVAVMIYYLGISLIRNPVLTPCLTIIPLMQLATTVLVVGTPPTNISLGVINHDIVDWQHGCNWGTQDNCSQLILCTLMRELSADGVVKLTSYNTISEVESLAKNGDIWGYMEIPSNFTENMVNRVIARQWADNQTLDGTYISLHFDMSDYIINFNIMKTMQDSYLKLVSKLEKNCNFDLSLLDYPVHMKPQPIYGQLNGTSKDELMPIMLIIILLEIAFVLAPLTLLQEYELGRLRRVAVTDVSIAQSMLANAVLGGFGLYLFVGLVTIICGVALGTFIALVFKDSLTCVIIVVLYWPLAAINIGIYRHRSTIPWVFRHISYFFPTVAIGDTLTSVIHRPVGLGHWTIYPGVWITIVWCVLLTVFCVLLKHRIQK